MTVATFDPDRIHGLDPDWCAICKTPAAQTNPETDIIAGPIEARHDGTCDGCNLPVHAGQRICAWTDGLWRHEGCTP